MIRDILTCKIVYLPHMPAFIIILILYNKYCRYNNNNDVKITAKNVQCLYTDQDKVIALLEWWMEKHL